MHFSRKTLVLSTALLFAACKGDKKNADPLAQDPTLKQDLELASTRDTAVQPQLKDVPTTTTPTVAPSTPAPAPRPTKRPEPRPAPTPRPTPAPTTVATTPTTPPPPKTTPSGNTVSQNASNTEGRVGSIAAGTSLAFASGQRVCTNTNTVGDRFTATLAEPVTASNGVTIPAGANAILEVTSLKRSEQSGDNMSLAIVVRSISYGGKLYPVNGEITSTQTETVRQGNSDAGKVAAGAVIGAILGRVLGGNNNKTSGTIIGAAGGAAGGAILARRSAKYDACIPVGGKITVRLNSAMQIQSATAASPSTPAQTQAPTSSSPNTI